MAATSHVSFLKAMRKLEEDGRMQRAEGRGEDRATTWLVLEPRQTFTRKHLSSSKGGVNLCRGPQETPCFRWGGLVGNASAGVLYELEERGPMSEEELAECLGWARVRDVRKRRLEPLEELGLIRRSGDAWMLADGYAERVEDIRLVPYRSRKRKVRQKTSEGRVVTQVVELPARSEVKRERDDRRRYEDQRRRFREALRNKRALPDPSNAPEELLEVPRNLLPLVGLVGEGVDPETGEILGTARVVPCHHDVPHDPSMRVPAGGCWLCRRKGAA